MGLGGTVAIWPGSLWWGVFVAVWGLLLVSSIDNVLRPYLLTKSNSLPVVLGLFGFLGGILAFGFIGVFLGPTLLAVGYSLFLEWHAAEVDRRQFGCGVGSVDGKGEAARLPCRTARCRAQVQLCCNDSARTLGRNCQSPRAGAGDQAGQSYRLLTHLPAPQSGYDVLIESVVGIQSRQACRLCRHPF